MTDISDVFRNINGISMQFGCIKKFDKDIESKGLGNGSKLMQEIVNEYLISPETIQREAEDIIMKVMLENK